jgi:hypothetical protein
MSSRILVCLVGFALAGCNSVQQLWATHPSTLATAADTRFVNQIDAAPGSVPGQLQPHRISCAEPSPDIATAVSAALRTTIEATRGTRSIEAGAAFAISRSIAELGERTATIQLLRDTLFRACEAYANGAISDVHYAMILSRYDSAVATLMSAEVAGRPSGPGRAQIGGSASAGAPDPAAVEAGAAHVQDLAARVAAKREDVATKLRAEQTAPDGQEKTTARNARIAAEQELADLRRQYDEAAARLSGAVTSVASFANAVTLAAAENDGAVQARTGAIRGIHEAFLGHLAHDRGPIFAACVSALSRPWVRYTAGGLSIAPGQTLNAAGPAHGHAAARPDDRHIDSGLRQFCIQWMNQVTTKSDEFRDMRETNLNGHRPRILDELRAARAACTAESNAQVREAACSAYIALAKAVAG